MSKVIEIVVIGGVGSGKSHVLALIEKALREGYGPHTQVVSRELSLERGLGSPSPKPSVDTIFSLKERKPGAEPITSALKIDIDTSDIDIAVGKLQGFTTGCATSPLESAIDQAVRLLGDERDRLHELSVGDIKPGDGLLKKLGEHVHDLLALQLKQLGEPVLVKQSRAGDVSFTELSSGRQ